MHIIQTKLATDASAIESRAIWAMLNAPVCTANVLIFMVCSKCVFKGYSRALFARLFAPGAALEMTNQRLAVAPAQGQRPAIEHEVEGLVRLAGGERDDKELAL
jgi:hypothetical protein